MNPTDDDRNEETPPDDSRAGSFFLDGFTISPEEAELSQEPLPEATDEFEFVRELGRGGMGVVYEVVERKSGRHIALKVISKRLELAEDAIKRFEREGRAAASISHDNCVFVFGAHIVHSSPAISMELMRGETVEERIRRKGRPDVETAVRWTIEVLEGIEAAHDAGVIHRDIKPSNVFLDESGKIKVGDFGLSRSLDSDQKLTMTGAFLGSPMYASPEQVRGQTLDHRTDIYSIGATLYTVLTGDSPFRANTVGDLFAQVATEAPNPPSTLRPDLPAGLDKVVAKAMARSPEKRFHDCEAFRRALERYLPSASSPAGLGFRALAYVIDMFIVIFITLGVNLLRQWLKDPTLARDFNIDGNDFESLVVSIIYFALLEGLVGTTPGKMIFGLRVTRVDGGRPGLVRAFVRVLVMKADTLLGAADRLVTSVDMWKWVPIPFAIMPFVSMRRRNGFRGVHEFASGTRMLESRPPFARRLSGSSLLDPKREESARPLWTRGELQVRGVIGSTPLGTLVHARDPRLARDVLVHEVASTEERLPESHRSRSDVHHLRWLDAGEDDAGAWDVYESPGGAALSEYADANIGLDWTHARTVLMALGDILAGDGENPEIARLWIDRKGRLRVLDFGLGKEATASTPRRDILAGAARILFGVSFPQKSELPGDIPEEAEPLVRRIVEGGLPGGEAAEIRRKLENTAVEAHEVPRRLRAVGLALQFLGFNLAGLITMKLVGAREMNDHGDARRALFFAFAAQLTLAVIAAAALRGAPVFKLLRLRIVTRFGRRASRLRCAGRAATTWAPGLVAMGLSWAVMDLTGNLIVGYCFDAVAVITYLGGGAFAIYDSERSLQDRLAGTRLVH